MMYQAEIPIPENRFLLSRIRLPLRMLQFFILLCGSFFYSFSHVFVVDFVVGVFCFVFTDNSYHSHFTDQSFRQEQASEREMKGSKRSVV